MHKDCVTAWDLPFVPAECGRNGHRCHAAGRRTVRRSEGRQVEEEDQEDERLRNHREQDRGLAIGRGPGPGSGR